MFGLLRQRGRARRSGAGTPSPRLPARTPRKGGSGAVAGSRGGQARGGASGEAEPEVTRAAAQRPTPSLKWFSPRTFHS